MRFSRDLLIVVVLFLLLIGLTVLSAFKQAEAQQEQERVVPYSTHSARGGGTRALQMWLDALGYRTQRIENQAYRVSDAARVLFVFAPQTEFSNADVASVLNWVERGNTLIVADGALSKSSALLGELNAELKFSGQYVERATLEQPLITGAASREIATRTYTALTMHGGGFVEYLGARGAPLLVKIARGRGTVWLTSAPYVFSNDGLHEPADAALVGALLSDAPRGSLVAFDEYHLGFTGARLDESLLGLIYSTPWGWALIYAFVVVFAFLVINGQRFGRTTPLPKEIARRSPAEYVVSMAQLFRRAGKRRMVLDHYRQSLKRKLGKPYHLNPALSDEQFVATLAAVKPNVDRDALLDTLRALNQKSVSERELVRLANQAANLMQTK